jgi:hypothetical protein
MKQILIPAFALSLLGSPGFSETTPTNPDDGISLMEEGAKLLLRGLLTEVEPAIDELQMLAEDFGPQLQMLTEEMGPAFIELFDKVDDFQHYSAPEFMPNGDIIIRRRDGAPVFDPPETSEIEL